MVDEKGNKKTFSPIIEIPLRRFFKRENKDFTPWLQENIELLGDAIGIEVTGAETEVPIGNYKLDILAIEPGTERKIAIENQFGTTNHTHLGQLITYMAGVKADVVVWIAEDFKDEHITAINTLNKISDENFAFFCIKPRIIKIENSNPALEFIVLAKPDKWEKSISQPRPQPIFTRKKFLKSLDQEGKEFFKSLLEFAWKNYLPIHWGTKGFSLNVELNDEHVNILYGWSPLSTYGQSVSIAISPIIKKVKNGDSILDIYKRGLSGIFESTGTGLKWTIKNIEKDQIDKFYQTLNKVIKKIKEQGLNE
ncbi:MAG TPA: hypothetical protein GXX41_12945 [Thermoanaerobacterium sp.]|nr:hypothetical protein [Thermoanaerobacterium sp.]